jgi:hypothetical protein
MSSLPARVWFIATLTLALGTVIVRLVWEAIIAAPSMAVISLSIAAILIIYALALYLTFKPSRKKLKSLPVGIWVSVIATAAIISAIIHYIRYVPTATQHLSVIIATLFLIAGISAYLLVLWCIWFRGRKRKD